MGHHERAVGSSTRLLGPSQWTELSGAELNRRRRTTPLARFASAELECEWVWIWWAQLHLAATATKATSHKLQSLFGALGVSSSSSRLELTTNFRLIRLPKLAPSQLVERTVLETVDFVQLGNTRSSSSLNTGASYLWWSAVDCKMFHVNRLFDHCRWNDVVNSSHCQVL